MTEANNPLYRPEFPRSNTYDADWVMDNQMGPNALWLLEWLCGEMDLKPGMRVLDLGCGTAMTSIFLAREFDVRVWADDLWIHPDDNWERVCQAGLQDKVFPIHAEAHALPFAKEFFDAVVSVDSYQYFGADELYVRYLSRFVRPGGTIGVAVPGLMQEFEGGIPEHLTRKQAHGSKFWEDDCISFKTVEWWRALWERSNCVDVIAVDAQPDGWKYWRDFEILLEEAGKNKFPSPAEALEWDGGRYIGFVRVVGVRKEGDAPLNLYDASLIPRMESRGQD
jgi:SAM-dependent methyltransferase